MKTIPTGVVSQSADFQVREAEQKVTQEVLNLLAVYAAAYGMDHNEAVQFQRDVMDKVNGLYRNADELIKVVSQQRVDYAIKSFHDFISSGRVPGVDSRSGTHKFAAVSLRLRRAWKDIPEHWKQQVRHHYHVDDANANDVRITLLGPKGD